MGAKLSDFSVNSKHFYKKTLKNLKKHPVTFTGYGDIFCKI